MILRQFLHTDPVAASYLFGCGGEAAGAVVDPVGDPAVYLRAAEALGLRIRFVIDTHLHADHLSAGRALAAAAGAPYVLGPGADVTYPHKEASDGEVLPLGNVEIEVVHTPGHTPEPICLLVRDRTRGEEPWFALTGRTLMVGDLGRTEDEGAFVRAMLADIPPPPPQAAAIRAANAGLPSIPDLSTAAWEKRA